MTVNANKSTIYVFVPLLHLCLWKQTRHRIQTIYTWHLTLRQKGAPERRP